jgi:hypothetical protein
MVDYPFYTASATTRKAPKTAYSDDFSQMSDLLFINAPNYFPTTDPHKLEQETTFASNTYSAVEARIDSVVDPKTGKFIGDDYKNFILLPSADKVFIGKKFKWYDNYWIATNTNTYESLTNACVSRRCNTVLKWVDEYGNIKTEPCVVGYDLTKTIDYNASTTMLASGEIVVYCQRNPSTNKIKGNRRFLFGTPENMVAYKICAGGVKNYNNAQTLDPNSPSILEFKMESNFVNTETDDIANGIADAYANAYTISIDQSNISQNIGFTSTLTTKIYENGILAEGTTLWDTSDPLVCTVTSGGVINCLAIGSAVITATLSTNPTVTSSITVGVTSTPVAEYSIRINPNVLEILEGATETFTCNLYLNEVLQADSFTFSILGIVPLYAYTFTAISGNSFSIRNNKMSLNTLTIRCVSGSHSQDFAFELKGVF